MEEENKNVEENIQPVESLDEQAPVEASVPVESVAEEPTVASAPVEEVPIVEETKEEPVKKKNSNKPLLIIILVVFMAFIFGLGFYLGKQLFEKECKCKCECEPCNNEPTPEPVPVPEPIPDNPEDTNNEIITMDNNDPVVQQLFNTFKYEDGNYYLFGEKLNKDNTIRLKVAYVSLDSSEIKTRSCSDLEPRFKEKGLYCGDMSEEMEKYYADYPENEEPFKEATKKNTTTYIEEKSLKSKYDELFSSNYLYSGESFGSMIFYSDKSLYAYYGCQCGGTYSDTTHTISSAYKIGDKLYLETVYNDNNDTYNVKYEFVLENGSYKFLKVTESK